MYCGLIHKISYIFKKKRGCCYATSFYKHADCKYAAYLSLLIFKRPPETHLPFNEGVAVVARSIADFIFAAVAAGFADAYNAAAPVTWGVAIDVPS